MFANVVKSTEFTRLSVLLASLLLLIVNFVIAMSKLLWVHKSKGVSALGPLANEQSK